MCDFPVVCGIESEMLKYGGGVSTNGLLVDGTRDKGPSAVASRGNPRPVIERMLAIVCLIYKLV